MFSIFSTKIQDLLVIKKQNSYQCFMYNMNNGACVEAENVQVGTYICELKTLEELNTLLSADLDI